MFTVSAATQKEKVKGLITGDQDEKVKPGGEKWAYGTPNTDT